MKLKSKPVQQNGSVDLLWAWCKQSTEGYDYSMCRTFIQEELSLGFTSPKLENPTVEQMKAKLQLEIGKRRGSLCKVIDIEDGPIDFLQFIEMASTHGVIDEKYLDYVVKKRQELNSINVELRTPASYPSKKGQDV